MGNSGLRGAGIGEQCPIHQRQRGAVFIPHRGEAHTLQNIAADIDFRCDFSQDQSIARGFKDRPFSHQRRNLTALPHTIEDRR